MDLPRLSSNGRTAMWIRFLETCKHALLLSSLISIPRFTISLCSKCHCFWKLFTCFVFLAGHKLLVYIYKLPHNYVYIISTASFVLSCSSHISNMHQSSKMVGSWIMRREAFTRENQDNSLKPESNTIVFPRHANTLPRAKW